MTDDLIARLRLLQKYHGDNDAAEAADALEAKDRRIAELESMIAVHRLAVDVDALKARIAELEAAIEPIIAVLQDCTEDDYDDCDYIQIEVADLRAARAALGEK
jgi:hypothetical protein